MNKYYIASEINYNFLRQRHQIFAEAMSEKYKVVFLERVPSRIPYNKLVGMAKKIFSRKKANIGIDKLNIVVKLSYMLPSIGFIFRFYNKVRAKLILKSARPGDIFHQFSNSPELAREAKKRGCVVIFDIIHNWWEFPYHPSVQRRNLAENLAIADIVISDSELTLSRAKREYGIANKKFQLIHPGVESFWFSSEPWQPPGCVAKIIFFGNLRANSDTNIIIKIMNNKALNITFYGLLDTTLKREDRTEFSAGYKGQLDVRNLAETVKLFDMILLPYDKSNFSQTIFPAKYFEVLATGKPVLSNSELLHLPGWTEFIWTSAELDKLGAAKLIEIHYSNRSQRQIDLARRNTWSERIRDLERLISG